MLMINVVFDWTLYIDMPRNELIQDRFGNKQKS